MSTLRNSILQHNSWRNTSAHGRIILLTIDKVMGVSILYNLI